MKNMLKNNIKLKIRKKKDNTATEIRAAKKRKWKIENPENSKNTKDTGQQIGQEGQEKKEKGKIQEIGQKCKNDIKFKNE